ncbi:tRNA lysidine(34) synthetase TilS [Cellulophaga fucicola]|uniref:tRNA(Ile)-lysidine synthase n=1 Tax=Cellulophaga fucicola TaxID=76595 RepID=A0A1K1MIW2_9FLAO|nr:tRNA lysidine(34) synthetase TilS [Cellulophaga fucicola]SFW23037.1 tRNA(Ile)-lysidine synthase [Cellulophaga fucicola]
MLEEFKNHIKTNFPLLLKYPFLVAVSGGVDSVVLTHLCALCNLDFSIAHCNFKLRDAASDGDEDFVRQLANKLNKEIYVTNFDTNGYVDSNKVSIQMAARELRYNWFAKLLEKNKLKTVVTGHQADDNLETFLINLSRGTGVDGLVGIPAKTELATRPLLPFTREQIVAFAEANFITWREDQTNKETKYLRNKIRHKIVPVLKELHPTFLQNFENTQSNLQETATLANNHIKQIKEQLFVQKDTVTEISVLELLQYKPTKTYMYALFNEYGFTEWQDVANLLTTMSGKQVLSKTHRLVKDRDVLLLQELKEHSSDVYLINEEQAEVDHPIYLKLEQVSALDATNDATIYIDKTKLEFPLVLRKWEQGDVFYPFGQQGKKKLSKYYKDIKLSVVAKEEQWLLCSGNKIVWVVGKRADNRFSVKDGVSSILKISLLQ